MVKNPSLISDHFYMYINFCRIAVYKAIYPSGGTLADVVSAIDKVRMKA